ncbi:hypothetical protein J3E73DRAFT_392406 [Bipolaris maydis]|nr:hypothetical protein J3E73DRAFT_392406 [Bipolaris maydis]
MSRSQLRQELTVQSSEQNTDSCNQKCCAQVAVYMTNLYTHGQGQLQSMYNDLQAAQSEVGNTRRQILAIEKILQQERKASELFNQQFMELQEYHDKLLKEYESCVKVQKDLNKSAKESRMFANKVARRAESLLKSSPASQAGGDVEESQKSAKNALLVQAISSQHLEDENFTQLRYVINQNVDFQHQNIELLKDRKNEVASLNKALKIATEDRQQKRSQRENGQTIAIEIEPHHIQKSKQPRDLVQYIDFLNRRNGELRLKLTFYQEYYQHAEKFKEKITRISQNLLQACIISVLNGIDFSKIRDLSNAVLDAVDQFDYDHKQAFNAFIAPYKASKSPIKTTVSTNGWI